MPETSSRRDIKLCTDESAALTWLDSRAMAEHVDAYALDRVDEDGHAMKKPLQTKLGQ
jgi:predicted transcriptional regulator